MHDLVCCIYHKAKKFNESEESSSDEDSDDSIHNEHSHHSQHHHHKSQSRRRTSDSDEILREDSRGAEIQELSSDDEPNAYERPPGWKKIKGKPQNNGECWERCQSGDWSLTRPHITEI
jgi:protein phosphatase 1 regulatory subunit 11